MTDDLWGIALILAIVALAGFCILFPNTKLSRAVNRMLYEDDGEGRWW